MSQGWLKRALTFYFIVFSSIFLIIVFALVFFWILSSIVRL